MNKWMVETSPKILRRVGKTGEESSELSKTCFRIVLQGFDGLDPKTGQPNFEALLDEVADVYAQLDVTTQALGLDRIAVEIRRKKKIRQMHEWESLYPGDE